MRRASDTGQRHFALTSDEAPIGTSWAEVAVNDVCLDVFTLQGFRVHLEATRHSCLVLDVELDPKQSCLRSAVRGRVFVSCAPVRARVCEARDACKY